MVHLVLPDAVSLNTIEHQSSQFPYLAVHARCYISPFGGDTADRLLVGMVDVNVFLFPCWRQCWLASVALLCLAAPHFSCAHTAGVGKPHRVACCKGAHS